MPIFSRGWSLFAQVATADERMPYQTVDTSADDKADAFSDDDDEDDGLPVHVSRSIWANMYFVVPIVLFISIMFGTGTHRSHDEPTSNPTYTASFLSVKRQCTTASTTSGRCPRATTTRARSSTATCSTLPPRYRSPPLPVALRASLSPLPLFRVSCFPAGR